jgi:hypothetical protein
MSYLKHCKTYYEAKYSKSMGKFLRSNRGEMALNQVLGIAIALIIAAFVTIPTLRTFAGTVLTSLTNWYNTSIATKVFQTV